MFKSIGFKCLFFLFLCIGKIGFVQVHAQIKISAIEITGNKKTRDYIVKRELPYKVGDLIDSIAQVIIFRLEPFNSNFSM